MFWRWNPEYEYMDREIGEHLSQTERLSQRLFGLTFWGDYSGSIVSRFHYNLVEENAGHIVYKSTAAHGQGFTLFGDFSQYREETRWLMEFLAFDFSDYPVFDDMDFSQWDFELQQKEIGEGFTGQAFRADLVREVDKLTNYEFDADDIVPVQGSREFWELLGEDWYGYWESADSLIVENVPTTEEMATKLVKAYRAKISGDTSEIQFHQEERLF